MVNKLLTQDQIFAEMSNQYPLSILQSHLEIKRSEIKKEQGTLESCLNAAHEAKIRIENFRMDIEQLEATILVLTRETRKVVKRKVKRKGKR